MELDRNGFPVPARFEDESKSRTFKPMRGRLTIVVLIVIFGLLLGLAAQNKDKILAALSPIPRQNHAQFLFNRANDHWRRGNLDQALNDVDRVVRAVPDARSPRELRGLVLGQMKRYREAVAEFSRLVQLDPHDAQALNNRAYNRALWRQELEGAEADIKRAIEIQGPIPVFVDTRGFLHYLMGRQKEALADLDVALADEQLEDLGAAGKGEVFFHRGLIHEQLGNAEKAAADYQRAKELGFKDDGKPLPIKKVEGKKNQPSPKMI